MPKMFTTLGTSKIEVLVSAADSGGAFSVIAESCGPCGGPHRISTPGRIIPDAAPGELRVFQRNGLGSNAQEGEFTKRGNLHGGGREMTAPARSWS
jgi:hypothetical protein